MSRSNLRVSQATGDGDSTGVAARLLAVSTHYHHGSDSGSNRKGSPITVQSAMGTTKHCMIARFLICVILTRSLASASIWIQVQPALGQQWASRDLPHTASSFAPTLYIRDGGHVAGRVTGSYDLVLTQRWIMRPEAELNFYSKDDPSRQIGPGFSDMDSGVRLRYEVSRKFSPYIGFAYSGKYGNTARYARQAGETTSDHRFLFGLRLWF